jgi:DNA replication protein DnaC
MAKDVTYYPVDLLKPIANVAQNFSLMSHISRDPYTFAAYCATLINLLDDEYALQHSKKLCAARDVYEEFQPEQPSRAAGSMTVMLEREKAVRILNELKSQLGEKITASYAQTFLSLTSLFDEVVQEKGTAAGSAFLAADFIKPLAEGVYELVGDGTASPVVTNLNYLQKLFGLSAAERALLETSMLATIDPSFVVFTRYFELSINDRADMMSDLMLTFITPCTPDDVSQLTDNIKGALRALDIETSIPLAFGIVNYDKRFKRLGRMSEFWITALTYTVDGDAVDMHNHFIREAKQQQSFSGALARIGEHDAEMVSKLLNIAFGAEETMEGCNVLLYGSRKLDKRSVALSMLEGQVDVVYELNKRTMNAGDYPSACLFAQTYLAKNAEKLGKAVLLIENTEDALSRGGRKSTFFFGMIGDGGAKLEGETVLDSDEHLLTKNKLPTIWLINSVSALADEAVGRFLLHCEVKGGTRQDRRNEVERVVKELKLPDELSLVLSKYYELGSHQIRSAARLASIFNLEGKDAQDLILRSVENSQKALGRENVEEIRESVTTYDLDLLNLSGRFKPNEIIEALKRKQQGTLCFYGPPGTGKTQLAEYIAMQLDKPLLIKRASDILSMWLGESEQNIKKMFDEARSEGAVLLLDEADSFMRDRALARASWEVTMVNELLTRMERFNGVFICATNLFEQLDAAALRRFTFKLEFHALTEEQRIKMFANETGVQLNPEDAFTLWFDLMSIRFLTPGDFATVKRQSDLLGQVLTPNQWIEQLRIEAKAKLAGISRHAPSNEELLREVTPKEPKGKDE